PTRRSSDLGYIARVTGLYVCDFIRLNLNQSRDALSLVRARVVNRVAFAQRAGINTEENQFSYKRIAPKLEGQRAEVAVVISRRINRLAGIGVLTSRRRNVERAGQIIDHRIDQVLHANVL